jgi:type VI protein secretion system component Hcp
MVVAMKDQNFYAEFAFLLVKYKATHKGNMYRGIPLYSRCARLESIMKLPRESLHSKELLFLKEWGWIMELSRCNPLYEILKKVDSGEKLSEEETRALEKEQQEAQIILEREEPGEIRKEIHLAELAKKYRVSRSYSSISHRLYDILCQIDRGDGLSWSEQEWMKFYRFYEAIDIYRQMQEFTQLKFSYKATTYEDSFPSSNLYKILKRLDKNQPISPKDCQWLKEENLLETLAIIEKRDTLQKTVFAQLKNKYQATAHQDLSASSPLYKILKNLDADIQLSESELNWLEEHQLSETLSIVLEIEQTRHFAELKVKYKANKSEDSSLSSHLYKVLKKIDLENQLGEHDINFLKKRKLTETITLALDKLAASLKSKIQSGEPLSEADFDWIKQNGRDDVITFAIENYVASLKSKIQSGEPLSEADFDWIKQHKREDIITFAQEKEFAALKSKYDVSNYKDKTPSSPLYAILQKLDKGERLEPTDVAWLEENKIEASQPSYSYYGWQEERRSQGQRLFSGKIFTAYHKIEALFYEQQYKGTGNKWNLANASSHWRKAEQPRSALNLTENLDLDKIKENKLKSALLTTRGGAFRDINKLDDTEKCALKAIEYQPQSHHPYTLMGAICFERGQFLEGERWFNEAIKRGASPRDQDAEMKRVVKNAKNGKRREVVEYLLKKDPQRYAWAKFYRNRQDG